MVLVDFELNDEEGSAAEVAVDDDAVLVVRGCEPDADEGVAVAE